MARNRVKLNGLDELKAAMRLMPKELAADGGREVFAAADDAAGEIVQNYPSRVGNLRRGVKVIKTASAHGAKAVVKSTAKHAGLFEIGTQARHTELGANRGTMPPGNVVVPIAIRRRRRMHERIIDLIWKAGATKVTGA